jgi:hypothetical protein
MVEVKSEVHALVRGHGAIFVTICSFRIGEVPKDPDCS